MLVPIESVQYIQFMANFVSHELTKHARISTAIKEAAKKWLLDPTTPIINKAAAVCVMGYDISALLPPYESEIIDEILFPYEEFRSVIMDPTITRDRLLGHPCSTRMVFRRPLSFYMQNFDDDLHRRTTSSLLELINSNNLISRISANVVYNGKLAMIEYMRDISIPTLDRLITVTKYQVFAPSSMDGKFDDSGPLRNLIINATNYYPNMRSLRIPELILYQGWIELYQKDEKSIVTVYGNSYILGDLLDDILRQSAGVIILPFTR